MTLLSHAHVWDSFTNYNKSKSHYLSFFLMKMTAQDIEMTPINENNMEIKNVEPILA
jgi:hypothetical protein